MFFLEVSTLTRKNIELVQKVIRIRAFDLLKITAAQANSPSEDNVQPILRQSSPEKSKREEPLRYLDRNYRVQFEDRKINRTWLNSKVAGPSEIVTFQNVSSISPRERRENLAIAEMTESAKRERLSAKFPLDVQLSPETQKLSQSPQKSNPLPNENKRLDELNKAESSEKLDKDSNRSTISFNHKHSDCFQIPLQQADESELKKDRGSSKLLSSTGVQSIDAPQRGQYISFSSAQLHQNDRMRNKSFQPDNSKSYHKYLEQGNLRGYPLQQEDDFERKQTRVEYRNGITREKLNDTNRKEITRDSAPSYNLDRLRVLQTIKAMPPTSISDARGDPIDIRKYQNLHDESDYQVSRPHNNTQSLLKLTPVDYNLQDNETFFSHMREKIDRSQEVYDNKKKYLGSGNIPGDMSTFLPSSSPYKEVQNNYSNQFTEPYARSTDMNLQSRINSITQNRKEKAAQDFEEHNRLNLASREFPKSTHNESSKPLLQNHHDFIPEFGNKTHQRSPSDLQKFNSMRFQGRGNNSSSRASALREIDEEIKRLEGMRNSF